MCANNRPVYLFLIAALAAPLALATDGYFSNGYSPQCKALAGACSAVAADSMSASSNPAANFWAGKRYDLGLTFFNPNRDFTVTGNPSMAPGTFGLAPGQVKSDSTLFLVPNFGANWKLRESSTFGIAMYGNGGMNTNYKSPVFGQSPTGVNLMQMFVAPTFAQRFARNHSVGVTAILAYQSFKAEGLAAFAPFSSEPTKLSNNGTATSLGIGASVGYFGNLSQYLSVGGSYQSRIVMSKFDKYAGLYAGQGSFDIPSAFRGGVNIKPLDKLSISADVERIQYSSVKAIANPMLPNLMQTRLGTDGGAGFGWKDITVGRFGVQVTPVRTWTLRGGFSTGQQPIAPSEVMFNLLAPGVITKHATFGFTHVLGNGRAIHAAVVRAFSENVGGVNPLDPPANQRIALHMDQWEFSLGFTFGAKR
ncbi:MAG TPA: outer membrane protein transport protein [Paludibaculum sp.]|jgi:long-chain fatty acid transport protein